MLDSGGARAMRALALAATLALVACAGAPPPAARGVARQSPVDLPVDHVLERSAHRVVVDYHATPEHLVLLPHTLELEIERGSGLDYDGTRFDLEQLHFHTPSEHRLEGRRLPLEMHLVHRSAAGRLLVVAVLFEAGAADPFLERLLSDAPAHEGRVDRADALDVAAALGESGPFYAYDGSLTTHPYTEGVTWLVRKRRGEASSDQIVRLLVLEGGNARDVQPLGARAITEF
ncbi:MAG: carbonic anhydrase family protein [Myxococcota bacterium]